MLLLCVGPKPVPVIVTVVPTGPMVGEIFVTDRASSTENAAALLVTPSSVSVTLPLVAFDGTVTVTCVSLQETAVAAIPLNCTWLVP